MQKAAFGAVFWFWGSRSREFLKSFIDASDFFQTQLWFQIGDCGCRVHFKFDTGRQGQGAKCRTAQPVIGIGIIGFNTPARSVMAPNRNWAACMPFSAAIL